TGPGPGGASASPGAGATSPAGGGATSGGVVADSLVDEPGGGAVTAAGANTGAMRASIRSPGSPVATVVETSRAALPRAARRTTSRVWAPSRVAVAQTSSSTPSVAITSSAQRAARGSQPTASAVSAKVASAVP